MWGACSKSYHIAHLYAAAGFCLCRNPNCACVLRRMQHSCRLKWGRTHRQIFCCRHEWGLVGRPVHPLTVLILCTSDSIWIVPWRQASSPAAGDASRSRSTWWWWWCMIRMNGTVVLSGPRDSSRAARLRGKGKKCDDGIIPPNVILDKWKFYLDI